jgi:hypothetical protein
MIIPTTPTSIPAVLAACIAITLAIDDVPAGAASAPLVTGNASASSAANSIAATEGARFSGQVAVLTAQCPNPQNPQATIKWGDGSATSAAEVSVSDSQLALRGSHTYAEEGSFSGTITGSYTCPGALALRPVNFTAGFTGTVADAPLTITSGPDLLAHVTAGHTFIAQIAGFTDPDPAGSAGDYTAMVVWGDGSMSSGTVAPAAIGFAITATHAYATPGSYTAEVRIYDHGGAVVTATGVVRVTPGPPRLRAHVIRHVGNGTAVLSLDPTRPGTLTILPVRRHHELLVAGRSVRISKAGHMVVVLKPLPSARRLLSRGDALGGVAKLDFSPSSGSTINTFIKVNFIDRYCDGSVIYDYTGVEQSCIVPTGVQAVRVIAVGGNGGNASEPCQQGASCAFSNFGGHGGVGALVDSPYIPITPGQTLYIEVGGNGGDGALSRSVGGVDGGYQAIGQAGVGGWNGGGAGQLPASGDGSGGGGGDSDVQTVSDQSLGFWAFLALGSRLVIAGGGGGGGSGGLTDYNFYDTARGGNGGDAGWEGYPGSEPNLPDGGTDHLGLGGGYGFDDYGGAGGGETNDDRCKNGDLNDGADGMLGGGGAGGNDLDFAYDGADGGFVMGYAGGGGGGGWAGGGGGGGGCIMVDGIPMSHGGGGGGGGSSMGPHGTSAEINPGEQPHIQIIPVG